MMSSFLLFSLACGAFWNTPRPYLLLYLEWEEPVDLKVCAGAPGGQERWVKAIKRTARHGAKWGIVTLDEPCEGRPDEGQVWIGELPQDVGGADLLGATYIEQVGGVAQWGIVGIRPGSENTIAPEHELLHVQGVEHATLTAHILSPGKDISGRSWVGVMDVMERQWGDK